MNAKPKMAKLRQNANERTESSFAEVKKIGCRSFAAADFYIPMVLRLIFAGNSFFIHRRPEDEAEDGADDEWQGHDDKKIRQRELCGD